MAWRGRPREEGTGNILIRRARAWIFARNNLVPYSVVNAVQSSTASNPSNSQNNGRVKDGLRCEWWFDEAGGDIVYDKTLGTEAMDLTLSGGERLQDPNYNNRYYLELSGGGSAYRFSPSELVDIGNTANGITVEAWVRPTAAAGANPGPGRIVTYSDPTNGASLFQNFMLGHGTWNTAGYNAENYQGRAMVGDLDFTNAYLSNFTGDGSAKAQLQHVVMTVQRTDVPNYGDSYALDMYVDGVHKGQDIIPFESTPVFEAWNSNYSIRIGAETGASRAFDGGIYLVAIYDKALSYGEIQQNFTEGVVSISNAYQSGSRLFIKDLDTSVVNVSGTMDFVVQASGTRIAPVNITVGASSVSGTYGVDFVIDDTTKTIQPYEYEATFTLSNLNYNDIGDYDITFFIDSATGSNVIQPIGQKIDSVDVKLRSSKVIPSVSFRGPGTPPEYTIQAGNSSTKELFGIQLNRLYYSDITVSVSGQEVNDPSANYIFVKDGVTSSIPGQYDITIPAGSSNAFLSVSSGSDGYGLWPDGGILKSYILSSIGSNGSSINVDSTLSTAQALINNQGYAGDPLQPTSANTGYRLDLTALQPAVTAYSTYVRSDGRLDFNDSNVPDAGLIVSGVYIQDECWVRTDKPIKFIDCYFSAAPSIRENKNGKNVTYFIYGGWSNQLEDRYGENLEFEYVSFEGCAKSIHTMTRFKRAYRCSWDYIHADYIRFRNGDYLLEECFFGPRMNIENVMWTSDDVGPTAEGGIISTTPHADFFQTYQSHTGHVHFKNCTLERANHYYDDGTQNPNSLAIGAHGDKIYQMDGSQTKVDKLTFDGCWIYGGLNTFHSINNSENPAWTDFTLEYINCKLGGSGRRAYTGITSGHSNKTIVATGNVWLDYGVPVVSLPQEAIDAGTRTANGSTTLNVNDLFNGNDWLNVNQPGLNEGGKTEWTKRATPL